MEKVAIIGAGPASLFAAYELAGKASIDIFDMGKPIEQRICPSPDNCQRKCKLCATTYGEAGAGLKADGKIIFDTFVGNRLYNLIPPSKNKQLVERVKEIFGSYGAVPKKLNDEELAGIEEIRSMADKAGIRFVATTEICHIGTDKLPELMLKFRDYLLSRYINFHFNSEIFDVEVGSDKLTLDARIGKIRTTLDYDKVILAPGRSGAKWLEGLVNKLGINFDYSPMDLGVRVEVKRSITDHITRLVRDMKFYVEANNGDIIRTFCTCPGGKVTIEGHKEGYSLVNGHSEEGDLGENTNFALLVSIPFGEPQANGNKIARHNAHIVDDCGVEKPLLQRLREFRQFRRSKEKHLWKFDPKPTLESVTVGDVTFMSGRIIHDITYALDKLNEIIPGIANDNTLIYAPETKFQSIKIRTDQYLQTNIPGLYVGGDGAGLSSGIVGAAACGVLAAEGIIKSLKL